jgi:hypothetical protein
VKLSKTIVRTVGDRVTGHRPSRVRASVTAAAVGSAVSVTVYKALRS